MRLQSAIFKGKSDECGYCDFFDAPDLLWPMCEITNLPVSAGQRDLGGIDLDYNSRLLVCVALRNYSIGWLANIRWRKKASASCTP